MEVLDTSAADATTSRSSCSDGLAWLPCSPLTAGYPDDMDSACSTPYYSAPSSPAGRSHPGGYYFSAPASPTHYVLSSSSASSSDGTASEASDGGFEFEFSPRFPGLPSAGTAASGSSMISADELFLNGQIRPMRLAGHLQQRGQGLAPLMDLEEEEEGEGVEDVVRGSRKDGECGEPGGARRRDLGMRSVSVHRRARSMSPLRSAPAFGWQEEEERDRCRAGGEVSTSGDRTGGKRGSAEGEEREGEATTTPSGSASASRSSSSSSSSSTSTMGRNSKRWVFLKDFLYRSKSEGRASGKEKFWHNISFSPTKEKASALRFFSNKASKSKEDAIKAVTDSTEPPAAPGCAPEPSAEPKKKVKKQSGNNTSSNSTTDPCTSSSADKNSVSNKSTTPSPPMNGVVRKRRKPAPSPHERHYAAKRAQAEELRKKTFLPYRQGVLGCLGFSSRGYSAVNGLARTLNTVTSR